MLQRSLLPLMLVAVLTSKAQVDFKFIENKGQWPKQVEYRTDVGGGHLYLEKNVFTYDFRDQSIYEELHAKSYAPQEKPMVMKCHAMKVRFEGANPNVTFEERSKLTEYFNYFIGKDRSKWAGHCNAYQRIVYNDIYKNIDMHVYTQSDQLKYDMYVHPGANPDKIKIRYQYADKVKLKGGNLWVYTSIGYFTEMKPYAYQEIDGKKVEVACEFNLEDNLLTYKFPNGYDKTKELVIDPTLMFATYSGSTANNFGYTATYDKFGFLYAASSAFGAGYPYVNGSYNATFGGPNTVPFQTGVHNTDIGITKFDTSGTFRIYSTYLGGGWDDLPHSLVVSSYNELFIYGTTSSSDFPVTSQAYDTTYNGGTPVNITGLGINYSQGSDMFVARLSAGGNALLSSTYIGGSANDGINYTSGTPTQNILRYNYADEVRGEIDIDGQNNIFVVSCTRSNDFPIVGNTFQQTYGGGALDGCVVKLNNSLSSIIWSSYIGGENHDAGYSLAIDNNQDLWIAGGTDSDSLFPITQGVVDSVFQGGRCDGFMTHVTGSGTSILESTYWGSGSYDQCYFIELDRYNNVYVFGQTEATDSTFIKDAGYYRYQSGQFISKLTPNVDSVMSSMVFGTGSGGPNISPTAFLVDLCNKIYLSGWGGGTNQIGGLWNNAGFTTGMDTASIPGPGGGVFQGTTDGSDIYIMVLEDDFSKLVYGTFMGGSQAQEHVDGGTSRFDRKGKVYQAVCAGCFYGPGSPPGYSDWPVMPAFGTAQLPDSNKGNCNMIVFKMDFDLPQVVADFVAPPIGCAPYFAQFQNTSLSQNATVYLWDFGDGSPTSTQTHPSHTYTAPGTYVVRLIVSDTATCNFADTAEQLITIIGDTSYSLTPLNLCPGVGTQIGFPPNPDTSITYIWSPAVGLSDSLVSNPFANPAGSTTYTLLISNGICTDTVTQAVNVVPVLADAGNNIDLCAGDSVTLIGNGFGTGVTYQWSAVPWFGILLNPPTDSTVTVPVVASGTYYFKVINSLGCEATDTVYVSLHNPNIEGAPDIAICQGDSGSIWASHVIGTDSNLIYTWSPSAGIVSYNGDSTNLVVSPALTTTYIATGTDQWGCTDTVHITVGVSTLNFGALAATADQTTIIKGQSTKLHAYPQPGYAYSWSPTTGLDNPNIANPTATPEKTTTYTVIVADPNYPGCARTASVTIVVEEIVCGEPDIYIPNAFTPNDDGENDVLLVRGNNIDKMYFAVYDRWGEKMFETSDQAKGWDGIYKGRECDPAVFVYYLEITCIGQETYFKKGNVTLIR